MGTLARNGQNGFIKSRVSQMLQVVVLLVRLYQNYIMRVFLNVRRDVLPQC